MSEENVEIVRRIYSAWQRGNFAETRKLVDPESSSNPLCRFERAGRRSRPGGDSGIYARILTQWRDYRLFGKDFRQVGTETVLVEGHQSGIGRQSGAAVESPTFSVWTFRNGTVVRLIIEFDRTKALEAAGLRE